MAQLFSGYVSTCVCARYIRDICRTQRICDGARSCGDVGNSYVEEEEE